MIDLMGALHFIRKGVRALGCIAVLGGLIAFFGQALMGLGEFGAMRGVALPVGDAAGGAPPS